MSQTWINDYKHEKTLDDELEGLQSRRWGRQLWVLAKTRKAHNCVVLLDEIKKGSSAYRPLTNGMNR